MNRFRISTPEGTRDLLFSSCRALRQTENAVRDALEERGYSEIITRRLSILMYLHRQTPSWIRIRC